MIHRIAAFLLLTALLGATPLRATPPETSLRPVAREPASAPIGHVRPVLRPFTATTPPENAPVTKSVRPVARPVAADQHQTRKGSVCGIAAIQGEVIGDVAPKLAGCGISDAVRVDSVSGVRLSRASIMSCPTAQALNSWVVKGMQPAFDTRGPVVELRVIADYACRTRNNQPGGKISEHGKGKALDIAAFTMRDGKVIDVAESWGKGSAGRMLRAAWESACGPFSTVLGPESDKYHSNHFHVDTASNRRQPFCH
jgi:hypothetical protein